MESKRTKIFLFLYVVYLVNSILSESLFSVRQPYTSILTVTRYIDLILFALLAATSSYKIDAGKLLLGGLALFFTITTVLLFNGSISLLFIVLILVSAKGISLDKIFATTIYTTLITYILVILSSKVGIVPDLVGTRWIGDYAGSFFAGEYTRHSLGFLVSNQVPSTFMMIYMVYIAWKKEKAPLWSHVLCIVLNIYLFHVSGARVVFISTNALVILFYIVKKIDAKSVSRPSRLNAKRVFTPVFIVCCILSFITCMTYSPDSPLLNYLDTFLNHRIVMGNDALNYYGVHLFGLGKDAATYNGELNTLTVDNGYISTFIQNGLIIGIIIILTWTFLTYRVVYYNNNFILLCLVMFAILNIINSDLLSYRAIAWYCLLIGQNDVFLTRTERQ